MKLKERLMQNAYQMTLSDPKLKGKMFKSAFVFNDVSMSFCPETYESIKLNKNWNQRIQKKHNFFKNGTLEMQSSNSSDALLMNVFCHPSSLNNPKLIDLIGVDKMPCASDLVFGWNPFFENESRNHPTEVDMKIGQHIFEAKLTENSFTKKNIDVVFRYPYFSDIFRCDLVKIDQQNRVSGYQLMRNIITAYVHNFNFTVLLDESRKDLINEFLNVKSTIKDDDLKQRVHYITWQSVINTLDHDLLDFMTKKYL
jgi:hypothetical protein